MAITVQNITATSAVINWRAMPSCVDTFYSVMYHPNWNSLLTVYTRKSFMQEDRIPVSHTTHSVANLNPQTTYILCVTCQSANPTMDQCQVFNTLGEGSELAGGRRELAITIWFASTVLLLVIAVVLLWGCVHSVCPDRRRSKGGCLTSSSPPNQVFTPRNEYQGEEGLHTVSYSEDDFQHGMIIENPFYSNYEGGAIHAQSQELRILGTKLNGPE